MHNLSTNYAKILHIVKSILDTELRKDGNFRHYPNPPKLSDIEILALCLTAEAMGIDSENQLFVFLRKGHANNFTELPHRTNFNRRRKKLKEWFNKIVEEISKLLKFVRCLFVIDSMPIPICRIGRAGRSKSCREDNSIKPSYGRDHAHKQKYYGFKLHLITTEQGTAVHHHLTPANIHDLTAFKDMEKDKIADIQLLGDKGYLSGDYQTELFEEHRIDLVTPLKKNMLQFKNKWNGDFSKKRKGIETRFSQLCETMNIKRNRAKSFNGLETRIANKIASFSCLQLLNHMENKSLNHIKHALAA